MSEDDYSLPNRSPGQYQRRDDYDEATQFDYTPYSTDTCCLHTVTRIVVAVLCLIVAIFAIVALTVDVAGFDVKIDYGFVKDKIPLERYKFFSYRVFSPTDDDDGDDEDYSGTEKAGTTAAAAFLIIALILSVVCLALAITSAVLRVKHEHQRGADDNAREVERMRYLDWLADKRRRCSARRKAGQSTHDIDEETYRAGNLRTFAKDEEDRRRVDQNIGIALFSLLIVAAFAFFMTVVLFAAIVFIRFILISDTANTAAWYGPGFWLSLVAIILSVIAFVLVAVFCLSGLIVCKCGTCGSNTLYPQIREDVYEDSRGPSRSVRGTQRSNPIDGDDDDGVAAAGAVPDTNVSPRKPGKRAAGDLEDTDMRIYDPVKKNNKSDRRDEDSATPVPPSAVVVAQGVPMALPGPAVPAGYSVEEFQRALQSGSQPSSSNNGYQNLGLPAPQYQVPNSYQPTAQRQPRTSGGEGYEEL